MTWILDKRVTRKTKTVELRYSGEKTKTRVTREADKGWGVRGHSGGLPWPAGTRRGEAAGKNGKKTKEVL